MQAADKCDRAIRKNKTEPIITDPDAVIFAGGFETLEVRNLLEGARGLDLFDDFPYAPQQGWVGDGGQIRFEGFAEGGFHAARARRWKILARLTGRDFSPVWIVFETFLHGGAQNVLPFFEDFGDGIFEQRLEAAFFNGSHAAKLDASNS